MNIETRPNLRLFRETTKKILPQTQQPREDEKAWAHLVDQADTLPMENRPENTRYNSEVDGFESQWLSEHGTDVALYPREQELAQFLRHASASAKQPPFHEVSTDMSFLPTPEWTRVSEYPLNKVGKKHYQLAKRLAETSPLGQGAGSNKVFLHDVLRLKDKMTAADRKSLTEMQRAYFPWQIEDAATSTVEEIYSNRDTGVRVEMPVSKSVRFENVEAMNGTAYATRSAVIGGLDFHVPEGSKVLLQGAAEFHEEPPLTLSAVESADQSGKAEFRSWFRYGGSIYKTIKKHPYRRASGSLQETVRFMVTAPPEPGNTTPRVLDSGVLQLPIISRREEFRARAQSSV